MKNLLIALVFIAGSTAMANEAKKEAPAAKTEVAAPAAEAPKAEAVKAAALDKKAAKEACLSENEALKKDKKGLADCIKGKMTASTPAVETTK
jgi:hypothetical protein